MENKQKFRPDPELNLLEKDISVVSSPLDRFPHRSAKSKKCETQYPITQSEILEGFHPGNRPDDNVLAETKCGNPITQ